jgi:predicted small metal-binding protein
MAFRLGCKDFGLDCDFVACGDDADEVKQALLNHAISAHMDVLLGLSPQQQQEIMEKADEILRAQK